MVAYADGCFWSTQIEISIAETPGTVGKCRAYAQALTVDLVKEDQPQPVLLDRPTLKAGLLDLIQTEPPLIWRTQLKVK